MNNKKYRGRLAPTPSGLLHIGHAQTFKTAWLRARERGGEIILRIEDIDSARCTKEYSDASIEDLKSIGLDWDGEIYYQSKRKDFYWSQVEKLSEKNLIYPCDVSRAQIKEFGKFPKRDFDFCESEQIFPESLRSECKKTSEVGNPKNKNWRFKVPKLETITFIDALAGKISFQTDTDFGDFLVWRKSEEPSYELAVVADDVDMKITEVVRGKDLLLSTARQILIYRALGFDIPNFYHCELLLGENGEKLSKTSMKKSGENKWLIRARQK